MNNKSLSLPGRILALFFIFTAVFTFSSCSIASETLNKIRLSLDPQNRYLDQLIREQLPVPQPDVQISEALSPVRYENMYGYRSLNAGQKEIYDRIHTAVLNYYRLVDLRDRPMPINDFLRIFYYYIDDHPEAFWVNPHIDNFYYNESEALSIGVVLQYLTSDSSDHFDSTTGEIGNRIDNSELTAMRVEFNTTINQILRNISPNDDELMRELKIFNYIAENVRYDEDLATEIKRNIQVSRPIRQSAYGAAIEQATVCSGFSKLFLLLTNAVGIECLTQYGKLEGDGHQWNVIRIGGNYYNVDVTQPIISTDNKAIINYAFFNTTDSDIGKTHVINPACLINSNFQVSYDVPACNTTANSFETLFAVRTDGPINQREYEQKIQRIYDYNLSELHFRFPNGTTQNTAKTWFNNNETLLRSLAAKHFTLDAYYYFFEQTGNAFIKLKRINE